MRGYRIRTLALVGLLCGIAALAGFLSLGLLGLSVAAAVIFAVGWLVYLSSERAVLAALRARPVSEVESPALYRLVRELCRDARLPVPRLYVSPAMQPNVLTVGCSSRSATIRFSRWFSSRGWLSSLASSAFIPPYWQRQRWKVASLISTCLVTVARSCASHRSRSASPSFRTICSGVCFLPFVELLLAPRGLEQLAHTVDSLTLVTPGGC